jgi:predicted helicase
MVKNYNQFLKEYLQGNKSIGEITRVGKKEISWSSGLLKNLSNHKSAKFDEEDIFHALYRPFQKMWLYKGNMFIERRGQNHVFFPKFASNLAIYTTGVGASVDFGALVTDSIPDLQLMSNGHVFPLNYYPESASPFTEDTLFGEKNMETQLDGVSDWAVQIFRSRYSKSISKEDIFFYVYGVLSSPEYQKRFKNELKRQKPRVPLLDDFFTYSEFGRKLAKLHLNYENFENTLCQIDISDHSKDDLELYRVEKMRLRKDSDKTILVFNRYITIRNIPGVIFDYIINGKSPIEWIIDRYQIKEDSDAPILSDPNEYSDDPKYVLNLLLSVMAMTTEILDLQKTLPKLVIPEA